MSKMFYLAPLTALLLTACVVTPQEGGPGVVVAPALPVVVELGAEPYYFHGGFYYYYQNNGWSYSSSRTGPWRALPRDRYPREVRYQNQHNQHDQHDQRDDHRDHNQHDHDQHDHDQGDHQDRDRNPYSR